MKKNNKLLAILTKKIRGKIQTGNIKKEYSAFVIHIQHFTEGLSAKKQVKKRDKKTGKARVKLSLF